MGVATIMNFKEIDWKILRWPLALLVICGASAAVMVMLSHTFVENASAEFRRNNAQFRSIRSQYQGVDEEKSIIAEYQPQYEQLVRDGVVGPEQRLDWVEALRESARVLKLPSLRYQLDTQKPYWSAGPVSATKSTAYTSVMTLNVGLLHEEDLVRLFAELERRAKGMFKVSSCSIMLVSDQIQDDPVAANMNAICTLDWLTVGPRETSANPRVGG